VYIPQAFEETRLEVLQAFMRRYSFGIVVSQGDGGLIASHLPFWLDAEQGPYGTLMGHMARANPHWQRFPEGQELIVIFQGPHAYVSPTWYETDPSVPTWNYAVVHAYGRARLIESEERLYGLLQAMVRTYEASAGEPWDLSARSEFVRRRMKAIVGFEIPIARLEGKFKLSQDRGPVDREGAIAGLVRAGDTQSVAVAELMSRGSLEDGGNV
jgi:transcriptional regulator